MVLNAHQSQRHVLLSLRQEVHGEQKPCLGTLENLGECQMDGKVKFEFEYQQTLSTDNINLV